MKKFGTVHRSKARRAHKSKSYHVPVPTPTDLPRTDKPPKKRHRQLPPVAANGPKNRNGRSNFHVPVPTPSDLPQGGDKPPRKRHPQLPPV